MKTSNIKKWLSKHMSLISFGFILLFFYIIGWFQGYNHASYEWQQMYEEHVHKLMSIINDSVYQDVVVKNIEDY